MKLSESYGPIPTAPKKLGPLSGLMTLVGLIILALNHHFGSSIFDNTMALAIGALLLTCALISGSLAFLPIAQLAYDTEDPLTFHPWIEPWARRLDEAFLESLMVLGVFTMHTCWVFVVVVPPFIPEGDWRKFAQLFMVIPCLAISMNALVLMCHSIAKDLSDSHYGRRHRRDSFPPR